MLDNYRFAKACTTYPTYDKSDARIFNTAFFAIQIFRSLQKLKDYKILNYAMKRQLNIVNAKQEVYHREYRKTNLIR